MTPRPLAEPPRAPNYPFYVTSDEDRRRFDLAFWIAVEVMGTPPESAAVWSASLAIYESDVATY